MNYSLLFTALLLLLGTQNFADCMDCEFKERLYEALREMRHKPIGETIEKVKESIKKRSNDEQLSHFAQNLESFLGRVIPNRNLVQDLMGYVSMPRRDYSEQHS